MFDSDTQACDPILYISTGLGAAQANCHTLRDHRAQANTSLARRTVRDALRTNQNFPDSYISFTSLPCAQDRGGENPYIDIKDVLKLLIVGDSAVRLLVAPRGEKLPKRLPNGLGAARSQSSSSASRTVPELTI